MPRIEGWDSPALRRHMPVAVWGDVGEPMLLFPTAGGDFLECERFLMIRVLQPLIDAGRLKVYACGTISPEAWMDGDAPGAHKSWLQGQFDRYLHGELLPFIRDDCGGYDRVIAAGASLGAYNAVTAATRRPGSFSAVIAMSGTYVFDRWVNGAVDENYFLCQPLRFLPGLEGPGLETLRQTRFVIASGTGRYEAPEESRWMADALKAKGVDARLELWGADAHHDWPTWRTMLPLFLNHML